eukprot:14403974-Alexandrium_andersonii.AAC.1
MATAASQPQAAAAGEAKAALMGEAPLRWEAVLMVARSQEAKASCHCSASRWTLKSPQMTCGLPAPAAL